MNGAPVSVQIVVIGAGFGGIGLGIRLKQSGIDDFIILERSDAPGGVWQANSYPGAACDVPSHLYSFSFEPRPDWPDKYATQRDILDYLSHCVRKHGLERHIRYRSEASEVRWDDASSRWLIRTRDGGELQAQAIVAATGQLSRPFRPSLPGIERFSGAVFHSAEWPHDYDLRGKRVAVIGTGASAIQFVPAIAPHVGSLCVFQRSAPYILPKPDRKYSRRQGRSFGRIGAMLRLLSRAAIYIQHEAPAFAFVNWPAALRVKRRAFLNHLRRGVTNAERRHLLVPNYPIGCKRILLSNDYYPAMDRPNVELTTEAIKEVTADAIISAGGTVRPVDCIIFGTGFAATEFLAPLAITGRGGKDLRQAWRGGAEAHLGITIAGFPNFFMLYGPNTNLAHNSIIYMLECQIGYVLICLKRILKGDVRSLEVRREAQDCFNEEIQRRLKKTAWAKGCTSWYLTAAGKNTTNWPGYTLEFSFRTRAPKWADYVLR